MLDDVTEKKLPAVIEGAKGGGKGGGGKGYVPREDPNTLQSKSIAEVLDLIGEGEIAGLVDAGRSIFFDDTPLIASDGTANFTGVTWQVRNGLPEQEPIPGFMGERSEVMVEARVKNALPITRTVTETNVNRVRVTIRVPALTTQNKQNGDLHGGRVDLGVQIRPNGGNFVTAAVVAIDGKTVSPYQRTIAFDVQEGIAPFEIRVVRITPDSEDVTVQNETWWQSYTLVVFGRLMHPDSALVALNVDSSQFGTRVPNRGYEVRGKLIKYPSNYNPETRNYSGLWDGSFAYGYCNNPAWVLYDIFTNRRYGIGEFVDQSAINKWSLYHIGRYCDGVDAAGNFVGVPDGRGGREPRFTINTVIAGREDAYKVIQAVASVFRGMCYWSSGQVNVVADMPSDPVKIVTPANVIDGNFTYSGTAIKARHTVAMVAWNDPADGYRQAIEVVEDRDGIRRFGWRQIEVTAFGCTSRGQAQRYGRWLLASEQRETETVTYRASFDHADVMPGDIILIQDPNYAGARLGGRVVSGGGNTLTVDAPLALGGGATYTITVTQPDGSIIDAPIVSWSGSTLATSSSVGNPLAGAMFAITASNLKPRRFRVQAVREIEKNEFEITGLFSDPTKYAWIDEQVRFDADPYVPSLPPASQAIKPPHNLRIQQNVYYANGQLRTRLSVSWELPNDPRVQRFEAQVLAPGFNWQPQRLLQSNGFDIEDATEGTWRVRVESVAIDGRRSAPVEETVVVATGDITALITGLEIEGQGNDTNFTGRDPTFVWRANNVRLNKEWGTGAASDGFIDPMFKDFQVEVYDAETGDLVRTDWCSETRYTYTFEKNFADRGGPRRRFKFAAAYRDKQGRVNPRSSIDVANPAPAAPTDVVVTSAVGAIMVSTGYPTDPDFAGMLVWREVVPDFDPAVTEPVYQGFDVVASIPADPNLNYWVAVAHFDAFGTTELNYSAPILAQAAFIIDDQPPAIPSGLTLSTGLDDAGRPWIEANWTPAEDKDFAIYTVAIRREGDSFAQRQFATTTEATYRWTPVDPGVSYCVTLYASDVSANKSEGAPEVCIQAARDARPPAKPTDLRATAGFGMISLSWTNPSGVSEQFNNEIAYCEVWSGTTSSRSAAELIDKTTGSSFTHAGLPTAQTRWYWVRCVNTSGNVGEFAVSPASATTGFIDRGDMDPGAPAVPAGLTVSSIAEIQADGTSILYLRASWAAVSDSDFSHYEWEVRSGGRVRSGLTAATSLEMASSVGLHDVRVRAVDFALNKSAWTGWVSTQIGADSVPPAAITGVDALGGFAGNFLTWVNPADPDLDRVEIRAAKTPVMPSAALVFVSGNMLSHTGLASGETWHYWLRPIDASGNAGPWTAMVSATTRLAGHYDILAAAIKAAHIDAGQINSSHVNATGITADKIKIGGATFLNDWAAGTYLDGTKIATGTVLAEKLEIGSRRTVVDIAFTPKANAAAPWRLMWSNSRFTPAAGGKITYVGDDGVAATAMIAAGSTVTSGFVTWQPGQTSLAAGVQPVDAFRAGKVVIGYWNAEDGVWSPYLGRTVITGDSIQTGAVSTEHMIAGTILGDRIKAGTLDADRINVAPGAPGLPAAITVGSTGVTIGTVQGQAATGAIDPVTRINGAGNGGAIDVDGTDLGTTTARAADPAAIVNQGTTTILPGKILIAGSTTLGDWKAGPNSTEINGGAIAANTITANRIVVGARGISVGGIDFAPDKVANSVSWTAGQIVWIDDAGATVATAIAGGSALWTAETMLIYWVKGETALRTTTDRVQAYGSDRIILAHYHGGAKLIVNYGGTIIDGSRVVAGSIEASQIKAGSITVDRLEANTMSANNIKSGRLSTAEIYVGGAGDNLLISSASQQIVVKDQNGVTRVRLGRIGTNNYGIEIFNASGGTVMSSSGTLPASVISGLGSLATQSSVSASQVSGLGSLATQNSVSAGQISGLGSFATLSRITGANIGTYIEGAAIKAAYIATASIGRAHIVDLSVDTIKIADGAVSNFAGATGGGSATTYLSVTGSGGQVYIYASVNAYAFPPWNGDTVLGAVVNAAILVNGGSQTGWVTVLNSQGVNASSFAHIVWLSPGTHSISVVTTSSANIGTVGASRCTVWAQLLKR